MCRYLDLFRFSLSATTVFLSEPPYYWGTDHRNDCTPLSSNSREFPVILFGFFCGSQPLSCLLCFCEPFKIYYVGLYISRRGRMLLESLNRNVLQWLVPLFPGDRVSSYLAARKGMYSYQKSISFLKTKLKARLLDKQND